MYRPRKRAVKETPTFSSFPTVAGPAKPLNFYGYKAGMIHIIAPSQHKGGRQEKMDRQVPVTVVECPPLFVMGIRAYSQDAYGLHAIGDVTVDKLEKAGMKKLKTFKKKTSHKKNTSSAQTNTAFTIETLESRKGDVAAVRLLVHTLPDQTTIGKKKAEVGELALSGSVDEQMAFAKEKFGKTLSVKEAFKENQELDIKAVTRGFGFGGVVARFGVKTFRPKAKYIRTVGSIGPIHPHTVMFTVARPGQLGYHNRTEFNKRVVKISDDVTKINPS
ncbi:MAG: 50S ribosomal protein L3, partial [archaeon]